MRCGDGLMAVPGDLECHAPSDCGEGRWGNIPIEANTVFVDGSYSGTIVLGTETEPFTTIQDAVSAAPPGGLIAIAAGSYVGSVFVGKGVRVWGRCPSLVEIVPSPDLPSAVLDSDASELHGVALRDSSLVVTGALDAVLDGLWIHDTNVAGLQIHNYGGATSASVTRTLVERAYDGGMLVVGAEAVLDGVVSRNHIPLITGKHGVGFQARYELVAAEVIIRNSVFEDNHDIAVGLGGAHVRFEASVVRGTLPNADGRHGRGMQADPLGDVRGTLEVIGSLVDSNVDAGIYVLGSDAVIEATTIRGTTPSANTWSTGIAAWPHQIIGQAPTLEVRSSLIEANQRVGIILSGTEATLAGVLVRDTLPSAIPNDGVGISVQVDPGTQVRGSTRLEGTRIRANPTFGFLTFETDARATGLLIEATVPSTEGFFGDSMGVVADAQPFHLELSGSVLTQSARAGLSLFGGSSTIASSRIGCSPLAIASEPTLAGVDAVVIDAGGNRCGCETEEPCKMSSTGVSPPSPLANSE